MNASYLFLGWLSIKNLDPFYQEPLLIEQRSLIAMSSEGSEGKNTSTGPAVCMEVIFKN